MQTGAVIAIEATTCMLIKTYNYYKIVTIAPIFEKTFNNNIFCFFVAKPSILVSGTPINSKKTDSVILTESAYI